MAIMVKLWQKLWRRGGKRCQNYGNYGKIMAIMAKVWQSMANSFN